MLSSNEGIAAGLGRYCLHKLFVWVPIYVYNIYVRSTRDFAIALIHVHVHEITRKYRYGVKREKVLFPSEKSVVPILYYYKCVYVCITTKGPLKNERAKPDATSARNRLITL